MDRWQEIGSKKCRTVVKRPGGGHPYIQLNTLTEEKTKIQEQVTELTTQLEQANATSLTLQTELDKLSAELGAAAASLSEEGGVKADGVDNKEGGNKEEDKKEGNEKEDKIKEEESKEGDNKKDEIKEEEKKEDTKEGVKEDDEVKEEVKKEEKSKENNLKKGDKKDAEKTEDDKKEATKAK